MDKRQKELIDTYLRKRDIAGKGSNSYGHKKYEIAYLIMNDMYDISRIRFVIRFIIPSLIISQPKLVGKFDLSKLNDIEIMEILFAHHYLIDYFKPYLFKINDGDDIANVISTLSEYDDLIKYFDLSKLTNENINQILKYTPTLAKYFPNYNSNG